MLGKIAIGVFLLLAITFYNFIQVTPNKTEDHLFDLNYSMEASPMLVSSLSLDYTTNKVIPSNYHGSCEIEAFNSFYSNPESKIPFENYLQIFFQSPAASFLELSAARSTLISELKSIGGEGNLIASLNVNFTGPHLPVIDNLLYSKFCKPNKESLDKSNFFIFSFFGLLFLAFTFIVAMRFKR